MPRRVYRFNVNEAWVRARVVGPWECGEQLLLGGQRFEPRRVRVRIYETDQDVDKPGLEGWNSVVSDATSQDRTDEFLSRPAGSSAAADRTGFAEDRRAVMVVQVAMGAFRKAMFEFLRALDLHPMECGSRWRGQRWRALHR